MVRSLYSGVAGMISHQGKMDVVGNNISNVSTYGYKHSRATFRDVYYQTSKAASEATATSGGVNPTQIGYGSKLGSVDVNHSQSVMSTTGYTLDVAIAGEGYLQVMDNDGNIFYTKAGMLDIDSEGNVVDVNGNFVLGTSGNPTGKNPGSQKIKVSIPYENAKAASVEDTINDVGYTITASKENEAGNVNIVFASSNKLPIGQKVEAQVTSSSIIVTLNANETFTLDELNEEMNAAITSANGGKEHAAGVFTLKMDDPEKFEQPLTGREVANADFGINSGTITYVKNDEGKEPDMASYVRVTSVGDEFSGEGQMTANIRYDDGTDSVTITFGEYTNTLTADQLASAGSVVLKKPGGSEQDTITVTYPSYTAAVNLANNDERNSATVDVTPSEPSRNLGLAQGNFLLKGGTEGGEQTVADLTGISINDKGVITATHPTFGLMEIGRVDLATFANPAGLFQAGNTYFQQSLNSGEPQLCIAGTEGTGAILGGTLETSNTDLSQEMTDMITTQRGFQACSRLITVSDTMLEELINLKR